MGIYDGFQNSYGGSFDRNTAVVVMDPDDGWRKSNQFFGKQFRASLANWSSFATGWTAPPVADQEAQWNEVYKPQQKYRTISEFCPLDIKRIQFGQELRPIFRIDPVFPAGHEQFHRLGKIDFGQRGIGQLLITTLKNGSSRQFGVADQSSSNLSL
jgi:hypothetical protein